MKIKIGIPRALLYYDYLPLWQTFFEGLEAQTIISTQTNEAIVNKGLAYCINEACLPIKVFHGHVAYLSDKVDYLFIPRIRSIAKREYICPKFTGLPDMIRSSIPKLPKIIDTEINLHKDIFQLKEAFIDMGSFICKDKKKITTAFNNAVSEHYKFREKTESGKLPIEVLDNYSRQNTNGLKIAVIGHSYNLYDNYINNDLFKKLYQNDVQIITPEMLSTIMVDNQAQRLHKKMFWSFARKIMGSTLHFIEEKNIDGVIYIMSFGCGIDSFIADLCERRLRKEAAIPFYLLILDEHSGQAGLTTRIEAFIDMLNWRKKNENNISTHG